MAEPAAHEEPNGRPTGTEAFRNCEISMLRVIESMQAAIKEASGENADPLPPVVRRPQQQQQDAVSTYRGSAAGGRQGNERSGGGGGGGASDHSTNIDTAVRRREQWEANVRERLKAHRQHVQDACADLHEDIGSLSETGLDEAQCAAIKQNMVQETAVLEERIVELYVRAARTEEKLMESLRGMKGQLQQQAT